MVEQMRKVTLNRRSFFQLATASGAVIAPPDDSIAEAQPLHFQAPPGLVVQWVGETPPEGWLFPDGRALAVAEYPELFKRLGYGYGRSGSDFLLPDFRAHAVTGWSGEPVSQPVQRIISVEPIDVELEA